MKKLALALLLLTACATYSDEAQSLSGDPWTMTVITAPDGNHRIGADGVRIGGTCGSGPCVITPWEQGGAITRAALDGSSTTEVCTNLGAEDALAADVDGDGTTDYVSASDTGNPQQVKICGGGWTLSIRHATVPSLPAGRYMQMDWQDGRLWLGGKTGSTGVEGTLGYFTVSGSARTASSWTYHELSKVGWTMSLQAVDVDGDQDRDLVYSDRSGTTTTDRGIRECEQVASNQYTCMTIASMTGDPGFVDVADLDGDGDLDLVGGNRTTLQIFTQDAGQWTAGSNIKPSGTGDFHGVKVCDFGAGPQLVTTYALTQIGDSWVALLDLDGTAYDVSGPADVVRKPDQPVCYGGRIYTSEGGDKPNLSNDLGVVEFTP